MTAQTLTCQIGSFSVPFHFSEDNPQAFAAVLVALQPDRVILLTDERVWALHQQRIKPALQMAGGFEIMTCPHEESRKTLATVESLARGCLERGATRGTVLLGIGGGVVGNLTGMTAGLLYRGIRFAHMPTTLLAMHDSVTSLKQGVNCGGKNILGLYHAPSAVFVDTAFLRTLPMDHIRAGLVELVKNALVLGGEYMQRTATLLDAASDTRGMASLIWLGIGAKCELLRDDPFERGRAMIMEYGHTIGHAIELAHGGELNHGDSVAWGMLCAGWIAHELGYMSDATLAEHERLIGRYAPYPHPVKRVSPQALMALVQRDNKRGYLRGGAPGSVAMVLLAEIGSPVNAASPHPLTLVPAGAVERAIERLLKLWR